MAPLLVWKRVGSLAVLVLTGANALTQARPEDFGVEIQRLQALAAHPSELRNHFHKFALSLQKEYVTGIDTDGDGEIGVEEVTANPERADEYELRYQAFEENLRKANERNLLGGGKVLHGITIFSDLTIAEFRRLLGTSSLKGNPDNILLPERRTWTCTDSAGCVAGSHASVDWRQRGLVTPVKNQGKCGSCWAFAAVENIESAALRDGIFTHPDEFIGSPQEMVSCDVFDHGCQGGLPATAYNFLDKYGPSPHALVRESSYPYTSGDTGVNGKCNYDDKAGVLEVTAFHSISAGNRTEATSMLDYIQNHGPVATAVYAEPFQTYSSGLLTAEQCRDGDTIDHAIQVVGYVDKSDDHQYNAGYWIIRNSWGLHWGEQGYINVEFGKNVCFVADMVTTVTVQRTRDNSGITEGETAGDGKRIAAANAGASRIGDIDSSEDTMQVII